MDLSKWADVTSADSVVDPAVGSRISRPGASSPANTEEILNRSVSFESFGDKSDSTAQEVWSAIFQSE